jgi:hypothetical protein
MSVGVGVYLEFMDTIRLGKDNIIQNSTTTPS